jgi:N-acetylmuramoyl-L-alanine amidase
MPDDPFYENDDNLTDDDWQPDEAEIPASVTFMEMMRHAAAKAAPPPVPPVNADQLFPTQIDPAVLPLSSTRVVPESENDNPESQRREVALEQQRIQRVKRRRARRRRQTVGVLGGIIRSFMVVIIAAGLMATIFTWLTPPQFLANQVKTDLSIAQAAQQGTLVPKGLPTPNWLKRVGIVSGHRGPQVPPDPGAVCPDGLTEASINFAVAQLVVDNLRGRGYTVDLLDEFDPRLDNYQAAALVSIHANTCKNFGEVVSGFLVAAAASRASARGNDDILVDCVARYYAPASHLERRQGLTVDMTDYHTFREIHPLTPAAIIELGFLLADRPILTEHQIDLAQGITSGILCFLEPGEPPPTLTPQATSK